MFDDTSIHAKCLMGESINIGVCTLHPLKLIDIIRDISFDLYNQYLSILCVTSDEIKEMLNIEFDEEYDDVIIDPFEYLISCCSMDLKFKDMAIAALKCFIKESIEFSPHGYFFINNINEQRYINKENFQIITNILKQQNCISLESKKKCKPKNATARSHLKKLKQIKAKESKKKSNEIPNIISAVSAKHPSINFFNIGNLTMYQLIDTYKRLNMIDDYFINVESLLHGASKNDIKLIHWAANEPGIIKNTEVLTLDDLVKTQK
jgi:hypothetical protein